MRWPNLRMLMRSGAMKPIAKSPLAAPDQLPLRLIDTIACNRVLVVAPHPDDETLGCGGAIALLRQLGCKVQILVISDGTMSHPRSRQYPAPRLRSLRESETQAAMSLLNVPTEAIQFWRLPDSAIPMSDSPDFGSAVACCRRLLDSFAPELIFLPWRYDPHADHRATWQIVQTALVNLPRSPRLLEYPIWDWDDEQRGRAGGSAVRAWRLDIAAAVTLKRQAIAQYRSQTTRLIDDDLQGFVLTAAMLANFTQPWEVFLEVEPEGE